MASSGGISPWNVDSRELGKIVDESLRELVNCWVRGRVPTQQQANDVNRARTALGYLVTRSRESGGV